MKTLDVEDTGTEWSRNYHPACSMFFFTLGLRVLLLIYWKNDSANLDSIEDCFP